MKMISWNVNGLRACVTKGFIEYFKEVDADVFSVQETKLQSGQIDFEPEGYFAYWNYAQKKGYSGVAVFTKKEPISVFYGIDIDKHDTEGRVITLEFNNFYHITIYTPNSQSENARLEYRMEWENDFREYINSLNKNKPVIITGDLNVAHNEIDLKNPAANRKNPGFTDEERSKMTELLSSGYVDSYRYLFPEKKDSYSWWSYRFNARKNNAGWRIDYFIVSDSIKEKIASAGIHSEILGSDHCPVELVIDIE